jgi:exopolyphosphatase/guanosine-5'-triphosphate,3'-diphosphate pyrophosphatase
MPAVIENEPFLEDGRPMPTRFWLVDAAACENVSRLEAAGGVRQAVNAVPPESIVEAHQRYAAERDGDIPAAHPGPVPSGGVGGTRLGVKCLHAHLAWFLAGGEDPVGRWTADQIGLQRTDFVTDHRRSGVQDGTVAAVDCGTNSTRLLLVGGDGALLDRRMHITRLGEGIDATRTLSTAAIRRTLDVLTDYRQRMDHFRTVRARAVTTSATRDAVNSQEFMDAATEVLGVELEVLSGQEEGRLSFAGATAHLPAAMLGEGPLVVVDIGGGSTEIAVGRYAARDLEEGVQVRSLDVGCVRVTERYLHHDPPMPEELERARQAIRTLVQEAADRLPSVAANSPLIGLAGTVSTLACLDGSISHYDRDRIHHTKLSRSAVERWLGLLANEKAKVRLELPGMVEGREDVIVGGALILAVLMEVFRCDECLVSEDDILDGLAASVRI